MRVMPHLIELGVEGGILFRDLVIRVARVGVAVSSRILEVVGSKSILFVVLTMSGSNLGKQLGGRGANLRNGNECVSNWSAGNPIMNIT